MKMWKEFVYWTVFTACGDASSFAIPFSSPRTWTAGSLVVRALSPSNFQTWGGTSRASLAAATCSNPTFYCSSCSSKRWRTRRGGGGDGAASGSSAAAAVVASTTDCDDCLCRRKNGQCSCRDPCHAPSTVPFRSPSTDIAAAGCNCSWTISDCSA